MCVVTEDKKIMKIYENIKLSIGKILHSVDTFKFNSV